VFYPTWIPLEIAEKNFLHKKLSKKTLLFDF